MKSMILQPDDFKVGMFVTIYDIKEDMIEEEESPNPIQAIMMMQGGSFAPQQANPYINIKGSVIRVDAINLPFMMTTIFESNTKAGVKPKTYSAPMDFREVHLMKLNKEYVDAYLGKNNVDKLLDKSSFNEVQDNLEEKDVNVLAQALETIKQKLQAEEDKRKLEEEDKNESS